METAMEGLDKSIIFSGLWTVTDQRGVQTKATAVYGSNKLNHTRATYISITYNLEAQLRDNKVILRKYE